MSDNVIFDGKPRFLSKHLLMIHMLHPWSLSAKNGDKEDRTEGDGANGCKK